MCNHQESIWVYKPIGFALASESEVDWQVRDIDASLDVVRVVLEVLQVLFDAVGHQQHSIWLHQFRMFYFNFYHRTRVRIEWHTKLDMLFQIEFFSDGAILIAHVNLKLVQFWLEVVWKVVLNEDLINGSIMGVKVSKAVDHEALLGKGKVWEVTVGLQAHYLRNIGLKDKWRFIILHHFDLSEVQGLCVHLRIYLDLRLLSKFQDDLALVADVTGVNGSGVYSHPSDLQKVIDIVSVIVWVNGIGNPNLDGLVPFSCDTEWVVVSSTYNFSMIKELGVLLEIKPQTTSKLDGVQQSDEEAIVFLAVLLVGSAQPHEGGVDCLIKDFKVERFF